MTDKVFFAYFFSKIATLRIVFLLYLYSLSYSIITFDQKYFEGFFFFLYSWGSMINQINLIRHSWTIVTFAVDVQTIINTVANWSSTKASLLKCLNSRCMCIKGFTLGVKKISQHCIIGSVHARIFIVWTKDTIKKSHQLCALRMG